MVNLKEVQRVYLHLVECACAGHTTTVPDLIELLGLEPNEGLSNEYLQALLTHITKWCQDKSQPLLTSLIVRASGGSAGLPPRGFWTSIGVDTLAPMASSAVAEFIQQQCFEHYQGVGVNNTELAARVQAGIQLVLASGDHTKLDGLKDLFNATINTPPTKPFTCMGAITKKPVDFNVTVYEWLQTHAPVETPSKTETVSIKLDQESRLPNHDILTIRVDSGYDSEDNLVFVGSAVCKTDKSFISLLTNLKGHEIGKMTYDCETGYVIVTTTLPDPDLGNHPRDMAAHVVGVVLEITRIVK